MSASPIPAGLAAFIEQAAPMLKGVVSWRPLAGGQSNPSWLLNSTTTSLVLRQGPLGARDMGAHSMAREYRVLEALRDTTVPVPRVHLYCADPGVIGAEFYLMDFVPGRVLWDPALPDEPPLARSRIYDSMNAHLAAIHELDLAACGLENHGRGQGYVERQLRLWSRATASTAHAADLQRAAEALSRRVPLGVEPKLLHGDYRLDNIIMAADEPQVAAIIDWELSTLGDPLCELGFQCAQWRMPPGLLRGFGDPARRPPGIPDEASYCTAYFRRRDVSAPPDWPFYLAFGFFRLAGILAGIGARAAEGVANHPRARDYAEFSGLAASLCLGTMASN